MYNNLKVLHVALQNGNYDLAAHALVYGMVKASIAVKNKTASHSSIPVSDTVGSVSVKAIPPSRDSNAAPVFIPVRSYQTIPAKAEIHLATNTSLSENKVRNGVEKE